MRLIDADAIDRNTFVQAVGENDGFISFGDCLDMLKNQPTAYDVDAVVDALWDEQLDARQLMNEGKEWGAGCYSGLQIAIETIRKFEKVGVKNENNN